MAKNPEEKNHRTILEVDLIQLSKNLLIYKNKIDPKTKLLVMVKAFSYGSGSIEIPKFLQKKGVDYLGVAYVEEGVFLRKNGISIPIMVMNPEPGSYSDLIRNDLEPEIYSLEGLKEFVTNLVDAGKSDCPIHIKLETGMNRLGFMPDQLSDLIHYIKSQPNIYIKTIFSHLSSADDIAEKDYTFYQFKQFEEYSNKLKSAFDYPIERHILNTAGIENYTSYQYDMVRLGVGLYGVNVANEYSGIKSISRLKSVIIQTKKLKKGDSIGYGRKTVAERDMEIAILPIGYADGLRRSLGNRNFSLFVGDQKCFIVGSICMDVTMIDITDVHANVGDEVEVFGKHNSIEYLANVMGTIPYEVLTSISQRVKRVFIENND